MTPLVRQINVKADTYILWSSVTVTARFRIQLPIRMLFSNRSFGVDYNLRYVEPIADSPEFVRNTSMVIDYMERDENVMKFATKIGINN